MKIVKFAKVASLFAMAFEPIFRWLQDTIIPKKNLPLQTFFDPSPCPYADDFAVAASSFQLLMTRPVSGPTWLCGSGGWVVVPNCEEFGEMKIVKYAKYAGTMIGPDGTSTRWTAPREKISREPGK